MQMSLFDQPSRTDEGYRPPLLYSPGAVHRLDLRVLLHADSGLTRVAAEWTDDHTRELIAWTLFPTQSYNTGGPEQLTAAWELLQSWLLTAQEPF